MRTETYCLAIDRGSTNIKTALYTMRGAEAAVFTQPCQRPFSAKPGYQEQDMNLIWTHACAAISGVLRKAGINPSQVAAVSLTGQGDGLYAIDDRGNPVRPGILSIDRRTEGWMPMRFSADALEQVRSIARGRAPGSVSAITELAWVREFEPDVYAKIHKFFASKDWVKFKLTGEATTDVTEISSSGMADLVDRTYTDAVPAILDMEDALCKRPKLAEPCSVIGVVSRQGAAETGLCAGTPVVNGATDMVTAPLGAGGGAPGHVTSVMGTWAFNYTFSREWNIPDCRVVAGHQPGHWLPWTSSGCMAATIDWYIRLLCGADLAAAALDGISVFARLEKRIAHLTPSRVLVQPYLFGGATDYIGIHTGGILNLQPDTDAYAIIHALYKSVAFAQCVSILDLASHCPRNELWAVGGVSNNSIVCRVMADVLGLPVRIPPFSEAACRGAAQCAAIALGERPWMVDASTAGLGRQYLPGSVDASLYQDQFMEFRAEMDRINSQERQGTQA